MKKTVISVAIAAAYPTQRLWNTGAPPSRFGVYEVRAQHWPKTASPVFAAFGPYGWCYVSHNVVGTARDFRASMNGPFAQSSLCVARRDAWSKYGFQWRPIFANS